MNNTIAYATIGTSQFEITLDIDTGIYMFTYSEYPSGTSGDLEEIDSATSPFLEALWAEFAFSVHRAIRAGRTK